MMKRLINFLVKKPISVSILILLQLGIIYMLIYLLSVQLTEFLFIIQILNIFIVIYILNKNDNPSYKMTWIIFILGVPLVGGITGIRIINRAITDEEAKMLYIDAPKETIVLYHGLGEVATKATVNHHTINLKAPTFKSADDARKYGLKVGDIYIEVDTLKVLLPI